MKKETILQVSALAFTVVGAIVVGRQIIKKAKEEVKLSANGILDDYSMYDEEFNNASGRSGLAFRPNDAPSIGHYCLKVGGDSGYFDTSPCVEGYEEVFMEASGNQSARGEKNSDCDGCSSMHGGSVSESMVQQYRSPNWTV